MVLNNLENLLKRAAMIRKAYSKVCSLIFESYKFSPCEIDILIFLSNNERINTSKELGIYLGVAKSLVARSVDSLIKRKLVMSKADLHDKRIVRLFLTKESEPLIEQMKTKQDEFMKVMLEGIDKESLLIVEDTFLKINDNLLKLFNGSEE